MMSRGTLSLQQQTSLANVFASGDPVDAAALGHTEGRIASLAWAQEISDPNLEDVFNQVLTDHKTSDEAAALIITSYSLYSDPDVRSAAVHPLLSTATDGYSARLLFEALAQSSQPAEYLAEGVFSNEPIHRAAALRWLHRVTYDPSIAWYLDIAAQTEFDGVVRTNLVEYFALVGRGDDLELMYPSALPIQAPVLRNFLLGLAISGSSSGWTRIKEAAAESAPAARAVSYEAVAELALGGSSLAADARTWLLAQSLDAHTVVQLSQVHAVGRLTPSSSTRAYLATTAKNGSVPTDVAYAAAFRLLAECSSAAIPYAQSVAAQTPHESVAQAINVTLAAWQAHGGPTCD